MNEIEQLLYKSSPLYTEAYKDGYEQAKREIFEMLKSMKALTETTTTAQVDNETKRVD